MAARIWIPLPDHDFEPTEAAVPWRILTRAGHSVVFTTENGARAAADQRLFTGVVFGKMGASEEAKRIYAEMEASAEFQHPARWGEVDVSSFDGLVLPGGHARGMRQYLDSVRLREQVGAFWKLERPVGAICHGVLVLARTLDPATGRSVLQHRRTTCLPRYLERTAYLATFWKVGRYYRTYETYVEEEVRAALEDPARQFRLGPLVLSLPEYAGDGNRSAFALRDGRYVSARWPGDAFAFGRALLELVQERDTRRSSAIPLSA
jgi:putative intracellular protease/amidase